MSKSIRRKCKICSKYFLAYAKPGLHRHRAEYLRGHNCHTCSRKCSVEWGMLQRRIYFKTHKKKPINPNNPIK